MAFFVTFTVTIWAGVDTQDAQFTSSGGGWRMGVGRERKEGAWMKSYFCVTLTKASPTQDL